MLSQSIFHLGEEGGECHHHAKNHHHHHHLGGNHGRGRKQEQDVVVGLQILIHQHHRHARASNIVLKQMVRPTAAGRHARKDHSCFLKACFLCKRELSPNKDVYMYRGDQGFCSVECRFEQILIDEARENDAMIQKERRGWSQRHHHGPRSARCITSSPRRMLLVA